MSCGRRLVPRDASLRSWPVASTQLVRTVHRDSDPDHAETARRTSSRSRGGSGPAPVRTGTSAWCLSPRRRPSLKYFLRCAAHDEGRQTIHDRHRHRHRVAHPVIPPRALSRALEKTGLYNGRRTCTKDSICFGSKMHNKARSVSGLSRSPRTDGQPRRVPSLVDVVVVVDGGLVVGEDAKV